ncbi:MAG: hypothetical protein ACXADH_16530 [Candidatus Kariarchaeaceae archaeon]|jgi:ribonucleoside-diphosphate reductase alpha chain
MNLENKILSDVTVHMKYARYIETENRRENWNELVTRNMNMHIKKFPNLEPEIRVAYQYVYDKKVLPSMRSMQFGGKPIEVSPNRIFNCAFCPVDNYHVFSEIMFLLLGGTGVGFSVQQHHVDKLPQIRKPLNRSRRFLIGDSIEGWADAVKALISSYFKGTSRLRFDYSDIRPKGARLVTSGGKAPGPQPLKECLVKIEGMLDAKETGDQLTPIEVHDIICHIADAVLAGGIRRAALISLFSADDEEMLAAKSGNWWELNPQRGRANPGFYFSNDKDWGTNPCCEIGLRPYQFCNLTEVNVSDVKDQNELEERVRAATFIGTLQASYTDFHYLRPVWQRNTEKDALIGVSMTGIASGGVLGLDLNQASLVVKRENRRVAMQIGIKPAARTTCVKPAGTTSLTLGTSSGIHAWHNDYYIRRLRVGKNEAIYSYLLNNIPELVEDDKFRPHDTAIITVPQKAPQGAITRHEKALDLLRRVQHISDTWIKGGHQTGHNTHNVSATVTVKPDEWKCVGEWMWLNRKSYNGLSVLPFSDHTYVQAPFTDCSEEEYNSLLQFVKSINLDLIREEEDQTNLSGELACAGGSCEIF